MKLPGWLTRRRGEMSAPQAAEAAAPAAAMAASFCTLGQSLLARRRPREALAAYQQAIDTAEEAVAGHVGQARAYLSLGERQEAVDSLQIALAIDARAAEALSLLAELHGEAGEWTRSAELLQQATEAAPESTELRVALGLALNRSGRTQAALDAYGEAIVRDPAAPAPKVNLGLIHLQQLGQPHRAEACFREALAASPDFLPAAANLGLALHDQGRYAEEFDLYREALVRHPDATELRWNRGLAHLALGRFEDGWDDYELRFARTGGRDLTRFAYRTWQGERVSGRLLVLAEQGLGDEIMFASCLPDLSAYADGVVLECAPRLGGVFARSFPAIAVHPADRSAPLDWLEGYPDIAAKSAIGSLPRWLRRTRGQFPERTSYLVPEASRLARIRARLRALGPGINVGVSWRAGTRATRSELRSIELATLLPALRSQPVRYFCLQHGLDAAEQDAVRRAGIQVWDEVLSDLDGAAALIAALDLVVTVGNTNAHLAGALGTRAWVLLSASPDWRWLRSESRALWYPTLELLRQRRAGAWSDVLAELALRLEDLSASRHGCYDANERAP